jgi:hypothetical protein
MLNRKLKSDEQSSPAPQIAIVPPVDRSPAPWVFASEVAGEEALSSFKSESEPAYNPFIRTNVRTLAVVVLAVALTIPASWLGWQAWRARAAASTPAVPAATTGTAVFTTLPNGASIAIDGAPRGTTPIRLSLSAGDHTVQITSGATTRTLPITVEAGGVVSQYVELAATPSQGGRIEITSEPAGAFVRVDGVRRGVTPLAVADIAPGQHVVTVTSGNNVVNRTVNVTRGATSTVVVSGSAAAPAASGGWLTFDVPVEMEVSEGNQLLGTTRSARLMLPVGTHQIVLSNPALELSITRSVQIAAGRTATLSVPQSTGKLSINAIPWADVTIDGTSAGVTPLGELSVPVGSHEVVFRHPQFGERRQTVVVKAVTPTRIGVDLRK